MRLLALLLVSSALSFAADPAAVLFGEVLSRGTTYGNLTELNDRIGGRPATSPAYARAVEFALAKFKDYGYADAKAESFPLRSGWQRVGATAEVVSPERRPLRIASMPWSQATPADGVEGEIADLGRGGESDFSRRSAELKGRIGLVRLSSLEDSRLEQLLADNGEYSPIYARAVAAGMAALLFASPHPGNQLFALPVTANAQITAIPVACILRDDALSLSRFAAGGRAVRVRLTLENRVVSPASSQNVIAELRGSENPDQVVIVGAHLDSWDLGNGALDNGVNAMSVIEVARAIRASGLRPRVTLRFALFGAEELGMLGSREHIRSRRAELDRVRAVIIMDEGAGRSVGFSLGGRGELEAALRPLFAPLSHFGALNFTADAFYGTDNFYYLAEGVPNIVVNQDLRDYVRHYHSNTDNLDRIDRREVLLNSALLAAAAYALADAPGGIGPRLDRARVDRIFQENRITPSLVDWSQ